MKKSIVMLAVGITCLVMQFANAQNPLSQKVQTEFGIGFATSILHKGIALKSSQALRDQGLSYFQNSQGERKNVGSYGTPFGWVLKPFKNSEKTFDIKAVYQLNNTRVEVDNVGNDLWRFSGLNLLASLNF